MLSCIRERERATDSYDGILILYIRRCFHSVKALVLCCSPTDGRSVPWGFCLWWTAAVSCLDPFIQSIFIQSQGEVISAPWGTRSSNCGGFASRIWMKVQPPRHLCKRGPCPEMSVARHARQPRASFGGYPGPGRTRHSRLESCCVWLGKKSRELQSCFGWISPSYLHLWQKIAREPQTSRWHGGIPMGSGLRLSSGNGNAWVSARPSE